MRMGAQPVDHPIHEGPYLSGGETAFLMNDVNRHGGHFVGLQQRLEEAGGEIRGLKCYDSLASIERPVDMVQIFRSSDAAYAITEEAIDIGAKVVWMQLGVRNDEAAQLAEAAGLKVVMNRCPKIELFRPFWKPRLNQAI